MLKARDKSEPGSHDGTLGPGNANLNIDLMAIVEIVRRQWTIIVICAALALGLALVYIITTPPRYSAVAQVMIDTRRNQLLQGQRVIGDQQIDAGFVESQVEVIKSDSVALSVVRSLKLTEDGEFSGGPPGLVGSVFDALRSLLGSDSSGTSSEEAKENLAVRILTSRTKAKRTGLTYVIEITHTGNSPAKAAQVANGLADAYMLGELESKYQATRRASRWLQERIKELRDQASEAERLVQVFKSENNIIDTGRGLMSEQQLSDINTQIATARAATAEARARLDRIQEIDNSGLPDGTVVDALRNDVITRLRAQYLDLAANESELSRRYGFNHNAAVNLRNKMAEITRSMKDQLRQIAETYKSEYEIARSREKSLRDSLETLVDQFGTTSKAQVKLKDLESSAQASRNLYDSFLQRFMEATQQQTIPISEARLISAATDTPNKTWPKSPLILAASLIFGLGGGFAIAWAREIMSRRFRTLQDVERVTGIECLGILPLLEDVVPATTGEGNAAHPVDPPAMRYVINNPLSRFTEVLRNTKVAIDIARLTRDVKVIGVVSALPNEGKSTVIANLAHLLAQANYKTLLIDGDLRNPSLTRSLSPGSTQGLMEALSNARPLESLIITNRETGLSFLPANLRGRVAQSAELLSSPAMARLLETARGRFDYILVDLAPITPVIDVKAVAHLVDAFVCVVEWGVSSQQVVTEAIDSSEQIRDRILGVVLNKADPVMLDRIENYKGRYYHNYYLQTTAA